MKVGSQKSASRPSSNKSSSGRNSTASLGRKSGGSSRGGSGRGGSATQAFKRRVGASNDSASRWPNTRLGGAGAGPSAGSSRKAQNLQAQHTAQASKAASNIQASERGRPDSAITFPSDPVAYGADNGATDVPKAASSPIASGTDRGRQRAVESAIVFPGAALPSAAQGGHSDSQKAVQSTAVSAGQVASGLGGGDTQKAADDATVLPSDNTAANAKGGAAADLQTTAHSATVPDDKAQFGVEHETLKRPEANATGAGATGGGSGGIVFPGPASRPPSAGPQREPAVELTNTALSGKRPQAPVTPESLSSGPVADAGNPGTPAGVLGEAQGVENPIAEQGRAPQSEAGLDIDQPSEATSVAGGSRRPRAAEQNASDEAAPVKILVVDEKFSKPSSKETAAQHHGYLVKQVLETQLAEHGVPAQIDQHGLLGDPDVDEIHQQADSLGGYDYLNFSLGPKYEIKSDGGVGGPDPQVIDLIRSHNQRLAESNSQQKPIPEDAVDSLTDEQKVALLEGYLESSSGQNSGFGVSHRLITGSLQRGTDVYAAAPNVAAQGFFSLFDGYNSQYPGNFYTVGGLEARVSQGQQNQQPDQVSSKDVLRAPDQNSKDPTATQPTSQYGVDVYANGIYEDPTYGEEFRGTSFATPEALANAIAEKQRQRQQ